MLLRNESRIIHSINVKLVFDDGKTRELELHECDDIQISYRKNGCIKNGVGKIRHIKPYIYNKKWNSCCSRRESAIIVVDMSEDYVSYVEKIDLFDILDVRIVDPSSLPTESSNSSDFDVTPGGCRVGCPITNKGVVASND